jgi:hypothetical protein
MRVVRESRGSENVPLRKMSPSLASARPREKQIEGVDAAFAREAAE